MILSNKISLLSAILTLTPAPEVHAHGYLKSPRSRNYFAHTDGKWWGGTALDPRPENCPHCLNIGGTEGRCGVIESRNYDYPKNSLGGDMAPVIQACYQSGAVVEFEASLTAYHMGHMEFHACPILAGQVPTQACFDSNPLTFISDELYGATPDPLYPARAYIPNNDYDGFVKEGDLYKFLLRYQLPANLSGDLVLIQWHYVTGNSCKDVGYDTYNWPDGFYPGNIPVCDQPLPHDGQGVPEQFWNCAEVKVSNNCDGPNPPSTSTSSSVSSSEATGATTSSTSVVTTSTPKNCAAFTSTCGPNNPCSNGLCCSEWGYCGETESYCGACCQSNCWDEPSTSTSSTSISSTSTSSTSTSSTSPGSSFSYTADHDSRLIAYVGNWQNCPTDEQVDAYSHIVIAFAVSYMWTPSKSDCDGQCNIASTVPICNNANNPQLVNKWRNLGKKVLVSFGGAAMGGSWSGDINHCWDYCFGKEEQLSTALVNIVDSQNFDGVDIDYEYCYDVNGLQSGRCTQRTSLYSDTKAQTFLDTLTSKLRTKLDALQVSNGYNRGRYELTHAPMDTDVSSSASKYYQILKNRRDDLDFLMPQFYNGATRPGIDGVASSGAGAMSAASLFGLLSNNLFEGEPSKVIFGFCISDCSGTGSNVNSNQAVQVLSDLKTFNGGEFSCNGGAFFWVAEHDTNGSWSNAVLNEVSITSGCSNIITSAPVSSLPSSAPVTPSPSTSPVTTTSSSTTTMTTTTTTISSSTSPSASPASSKIPTQSSCYPLASTVKLESTTGKMLNAFEIKVYTAGQNIATAGTATQSSTLRGKQKFAAPSAIDGNDSTYIHTDRSDTSPWWQVLLTLESEIESVEIRNRWCGDENDQLKCLCRMSGAKLSLLDDQGSVIVEKTLADTCGQLTLSLDFDSTCTDATPSSSPVAGTAYPKARVLKLYSSTGEPISMYEFRVISSGGANVAEGKTAIQSSTMKNKFPASYAVDGNANTFSHTKSAGYNWFQVDLENSFVIESVEIVNRWCGNKNDAKGCLCRLSHAVLSLYGDTEEWITTVSLGSMCGTIDWSHNFSDYGSSSCTAWS